MSHNESIKYHSECDYLDLQNQSSINMLNKCVGGITPPMNNKGGGDIIEGYGDIIEGYGDIIEGYGDNNQWYTDRIECPSRKKGEKECPDSYSNINGECVQVCRGCTYNDSKGYFGNCGGENINEKTKATRMKEVNDEIFNYLYDGI